MIVNIKKRVKYNIMNVDFMPNPYLINTEIAVPIEICDFPLDIDNSSFGKDFHSYLSECKECFDKVEKAQED